MSTPPTISRRSTVLALASLTGLGWTRQALAEPGVSAEQVLVGQSIALSGPLGDLGQEVHRGNVAGIAQINARGGVHGRTIGLMTRDDAYDTAKTLENVKTLIDGEGVFCLFNTFGTPNNEALIPVARAAEVPVVAPYTGAPSIRSRQTAGVFNVRASYADEVDKLVEHLNTIGVKRIAVAYQNNAFGKEVLSAVVDSLKKRNLAPLVSASVENNASDAAAAAGRLIDAGPEVLLLGLAGKPTIETIRSVNLKRRGYPMYALSVLATPSNLKALGADGTGLAITQVVPHPHSTSLALVRDYQAAMRASGFEDFSHQSLEGYVNARVLAEGLRRTGKNPTRSSFESTMDSLRRFDLGGMEISFGQGSLSGSRLVELTMVNAQGRLIR